MENLQILSEVIVKKDKEISSLRDEIKDLKAQVMCHIANTNAWRISYEDRTTQLQKERAQALADRVAILGPDCRAKYLALFLHYNSLLDSTDREKAVQLSKAAKPTKKKHLATAQQPGLF